MNARRLDRVSGSAATASADHATSCARPHAHPHHAPSSPTHTSALLSAAGAAGAMLRHLSGRRVRAHPAAHHQPGAAGRATAPPAQHAALQNRHHPPRLARRRRDVLTVTGRGLCIWRGRTGGGEKRRHGGAAVPASGTRIGHGQASPAQGKARRPHCTAATATVRSPCIVCYR